MSRLIIATVDFGLMAPMRSGVNRGRRRIVRQEGAYNLDGSSWDFGLAEGFRHVFQSQQQVGFLTPADKATLEDLFDTGDAFTVQTDLLGSDDTLETFTGAFDYSNPPTYSPADIRGELWLFVIPVYLSKTS